MIVRLLVLFWIVLAAAPVEARRAPSRRPSYDRPFTPPKLSRGERKRLDIGLKRDLKLSVSATAKKIEKLAAQHPDRVKLSVIGRVEALPIYRVDVKPLSARGKRPLQVLVAAGVHGSEPAGVLAAMKLLDRAVRDKGMQSRYALTVLPMVNPTGLRDRARRNSSGQDVNRTFRRGKWSAEASAVARSIAGQRFDMFIDLHGSPKPGYFLIRGSEDGAVSRRALGALGKGLLLHSTNNDGTIGSYKLHSLGGATSNNPGTFKGYMIDKGTRYSYTLEYSRVHDPARQVPTMFKLLRSTLDNAYQHGRF